MKITAQQYISNNKGDTSYITTFKHQYNKTDKKASKKGDIHGLIKITAEKKISAERIAKFVWDSIVDGYIYHPNPSTNESLKNAIEEGLNKVKHLISNDKELEQTGIDVSFTIILVKEEGTYVGVLGESDIYAFKKGKIVNIANIISEKRANTAGIILEKDDILMVSSKNLLSNIEQKIFKLTRAEDISAELQEAGESIGQNEGLIFFKNSEEKKKFSKSKKVNIPIFTKPVARVESIKHVEQKKTLFKDTDKDKFNNFFKEAKLHTRNLGKEIQKKITKIQEFLSKKTENIKESLVRKFGKQKWYKKLASKYSTVKVVKKKNVTPRGFRIDGYKEKEVRSKRFKTLFLVLVVVILLIFGINSTIRFRNAREISKQANEVFSQIDELLSKTENNLLADRSSAETDLFRAEKLLDEIPADLGEKDIEKFEDIKNKFQSLGDSLYKRVAVTEGSNLEKYIDTRLTFGEGSEVTDMSIYRDREGNEFLFVADAGRKTIYRVTLYDKSVKALPDNDGLVREPKYIYAGTQGVYVFDSRGGVLKAGYTEEGWFTPFVKLSGLGISDIRSSDIAEMTIWTLSDNVYFLSRDRGALMKSSPAYEERYGLAFPYIEHPEFPNAVSMIADLSLYFILPQEPYLIRFNYSFFENKYVEAPLTYLSFDGDFGSPTKAFTGDSLDYGLYLYDTQEKRILRFQKPVEGGGDLRHPNQISLLAQYVYRGENIDALKEVKDIVVDNSENNLYIAESSIIWKISL